MQLALIGVGHLGSAVVDSLTAYDRLLSDGFVAGSVVVDSDPASLASLRAVPRRNRVVVGSAYPCREGVDGDNQLGASIAAEDIELICSGVDCIPSHRADAFLVVSALGGGIGGGGAPVIARELHRLFDKPIYGLSVLPPNDADTATAHRCVRSLVTFVREVDNLILVEGLDETRRVDVNEMTRRLVSVCAPTQSSQNVDADGFGLDALLDGCDLSFLARAVAPTKRHGLLDVAVDTGNASGGDGDDESTDGSDRTNVPTLADGTVFELVRASVADSDTATVPRANRAMLVVTGQKELLLQARDDIERSRTWLRETTDVATVGVRGIGTNGPLTVSVLLSGVRGVPRLGALWNRAIGTDVTGLRTDQVAQSTPGHRERTFDPLF